MFGKKLLATAVSAVLAASLCPGLALATPLEAGVATETGQALSTQATKTMYVVSKVNLDMKSTYTDADGKAQTQKLSREYAYKYKNGLMTSGMNTSMTLTYDGINLKKVVGGGNAGTFTYTSKKGVVQSGVSTYDDMKTKITFVHNSKGILTKQVWQGFRKTNGKWVEQSKNTVQYTIKGGYPTKTTMVNTSGKYPNEAFTYDKNGNINSARNLNESFKGTMTNSYDKSKRLTKRVVKSLSGTYTYKYTYKKVTVPSASVSTIKAQQWGLLNRNMNAAFGQATPCPLYW